MTGKKQRAQDSGILKLNKTEIRYSFLKDRDNRWMQVVYTIVPEKPERIANQIQTIENAEGSFYNIFQIGNQTAAAKRFFSSDLVTHSDEIDNYKKRQGTDFFLSVTEQPPASGVKLSLLGMCLNNITSKLRDENIIRFDTTSGIRHIFAEHLIDSVADEHSDSQKQTERIFAYLQKKLSEFNATIQHNILRTWIYAPHVDADYPGIVKARKDLFEKINLTKETHFIASTGIQGGTGNRFSRVSMDAYGVIGIAEDNIRYIHTPEHLCPTHIYGVTFERATAVRLGKTDFLFISGTASIDKNGDIVYPGDVEKQTLRTLENISALLNSAGFNREDLSSLIVYLRDMADYGFTKPLIDQYLKNLPTVYVKAPVCRPAWLIEIEATAVKLVG
ncbi:MAG: putative aminoacrylate peracid reductase RutC [Syntrophorhabdus sp. PtaU1.Bin050]|nr:MAG: putative aminoacrylate peracid reductase RutC [Syntrophorhabdus sp. PtaU1.Bin050]